MHALPSFAPNRDPRRARRSGPLRRRGRQPGRRRSARQSARRRIRGESAVRSLGCSCRVGVLAIRARCCWLRRLHCLEQADPQSGAARAGGADCVNGGRLCRASPGACWPGLTTGPPQTGARSPAGPGPPRAGRSARTGRREPGPGPRRPGPSGLDRPGAWSPDRTGDRARRETPRDAPRGRTADRADRTVPRWHRSGRPATVRPRSARRRTGLVARSAGHGTGNERGSERRCPPDTARVRRGRHAPPAGWLCPAPVASRRRPAWPAPLTPESAPDARRRH